MRCPACDADNPADAKACVACKQKLGRPSRRRELTLPPDPWVGRTLGHTAYRCSIWGLIPFLGLVLGPVAVILAVSAWWRDRRAPPEDVRGVLWVALVLGGLLWVTNWVGVYLMIRGLTP